MVRQAGKGFKLWRKPLRIYMVQWLHLIVVYETEVLVRRCHGWEKLDIGQESL